MTKQAFEKELNKKIISLLQKRMIKMQKWKFPYGVDLTPTGHNNTAIEMFLDNIVESLTREVIQNSLDAQNTEVNEPVLVTFDFNNITRNRIPDIQAINKSLRKAKEMWEEKGDKDTLKFLNHFEEAFNQPKIPLLKISDYNTTGLNQKSYESLIVGSGYSQKSSEASAGSKGIGKAAPFAASDLRMVFYNTVSQEGYEKSAGIMNFVSYYRNKKNNEITQERASYVDDKEDFIDGQFTFNYPHRAISDFGTDLFIIGLKDIKKWEDKIILSTLNNFLLSIFNNDLKIRVADTELNSKNLKKTLDELKKLGLNTEEKATFENTLRYYDVITNENALTFNLDNRFDKYPFIDNSEDGILTILDHEPANRMVLQTREAGMKIYERNRISGNINFSGVFQATGKEFNAFLKDMENANHDKWSPDRLHGSDKKDAENLLTDLLQWYKQIVKENYETKSTGEVGAFGVNDLLPVQTKDDAEEEKKDSGIRNKIQEISISRKEPTIPFKDGDSEEGQLTEVIDQTENGPGNSSGKGSNQQGQSGGDSPDPHYGGGPDHGEYGGQGENTSNESQKLVGPSRAFRLKVIEIDSTEGKYRILAFPKKSMKKIKIELKYVGADGKSYNIKLLNAESDTTLPSIINNTTIQLESIKKNKNFNIDFNTKSNLRMKMEALIYEVKS
ncbi:MAG TPA: hypothetical protein VK105_07200 [Virgibacillus sp.]|nr:hypothetical protein [Virgibacillus sp.]HLR66908.1 hypothetical protein [Virgibacillus sp.]